MIWETFGNNVSDPLEWGWCLSRGIILELVFTNYDFAPEALLNFVRCKCKGECSLNESSCHKHDLKCVTDCGNWEDDYTNSKVLVNQN